MNIFITILLILAVLVAVVFVVALFVKKDYVISRDINVLTSRQKAFDYIRFLRNQDNYSKWVMVDPDMKKDFKGTDGTVGFVYRWDGNQKAGKGEQEIIGINEGERIAVELRFIKPFAGVARAHMTTQVVNGDGTNIRWTMEGSNPYPRNLMNPLIGSILGKDLELSLSNLKSILENK